MRGRAHLARGEFTAARQVLEDTIHQAPQALHPYVFLSHVLLLANDEATAESILRRIVTMDPGQADSWYNLALLLRRGRLREAIAAVQSGRLYLPDDPDLLLLHGTLLREAGDLINAENCLLHMLETHAGDEAASRRRYKGRHNLALVYRAMGRMDEAITLWRIPPS